jgi:hypothetical protein
MHKDKDYRFKNHTDLTKIAVFLLYAYLVASVIFAISSIYEYNLLLDVKHGVTISKDIANADDSRQTLLGGIWGVSMFATIFFFCLWLYRVDNNALSFHPKETKNTPGWSIGWYFVPFVNLYAGHESMQEIWKVSKNPSYWKEELSSTLIKWWWFFWISSNILFTIASKMEKTKDIDSIMNVSLINISGYIGQAICAYLLILIIKEIYKLQVHTYKTLKAAAKNNGTYSDGTAPTKENEPLKIEAKKIDDLPF